MKMENPITAHRDGVISSVAVEVGGTVTAGAVIAEIGDAD
jgi:acetyl-CoA/propionyl-CoA carboxylase biotin carboxyl carrier protein